MAVVRIALPVATRRLFDYWVPAGLAVDPGAVVLAKLGGRRVVGVVVEIVDRTEVEPEKLQPIDEVIRMIPPLPEDLRSLAGFVASYYHQPIGLSFALLLPPLGAKEPRPGELAGRYRLSPLGRVELARADRGRGPRQEFLLRALDAEGGAATDAIRRQGAHAWRQFVAWRAAGWVEAVPKARAAGCGVSLNPDQEAAIEAAIVAPARFHPTLLQGVTGSGKTEVYLAAAARTIASGRQALLLVPEINLTPQLEQRIADSLPGISVGVLHSRLPPAVRRERWLKAGRGEIQLVVGTRLAVFTPMPGLGLIVVDEEHDASFRQEEGVRYHARDVAIYRARLRSLPVILGSATPSLESYAQAQRGRYRWIRLDRRATSREALPVVRLVPNRGAGSIEGVGTALQESIAQRIAQREQTLVFINRRGYAPSLLCAACGWRAMCPRCAARLVVHRQTQALRCHHCGHSVRAPRACPDCGNLDLLPLGFGTQRLERALALLFPSARVLRIDRDSTRRTGAFAAMREVIAGGDADILVGTQMLAKGHDFPQLTLVGVLGADNALYSAEFRATERLFALLEQVGGRAGRGERSGEVVVQTDFPEHPLYQALTRHDFDAHARALLAERKALALPPMAHLALLAGEAKSSDDLMGFLASTAERGRALASTRGLACTIYSPVPAALARRAGLNRAQVVVQSGNRRVLQDFLSEWLPAIEDLGEHRVRWVIDVDPPGFA